MVINKDEATEALSTISAANNRANSMQLNKHMSPHLILWGVIWLVANSITELQPVWANTAWLLLTIGGAAISMWLGMRSYQVDTRAAVTGVQTHTASKYSWQFAITGAVIFVYFVALFAVIPKLDPKQINAIISLFWAFSYMLLGTWISKRVLLVGLLAGMSTLIGYFYVSEHYFLWMGLVSGGFLILGGLWLRKV